MATPPRNAPCPCKSGRKAKRCCYAPLAVASREADEVYAACEQEHKRAVAERLSPEETKAAYVRAARQVVARRRYSAPSQARKPGGFKDRAEAKRKARGA